LDASWGTTDLDTLSWRERYLASINKRWEDLSPQQQKFVEDAERDDESWKKVVAPGIATGS
jgi:hypothetical protein